MAGQTGVADHLSVGDGATVGGQAGITTDIAPGATVLGMPAIDAMTFKRMHLYSRRLGELFQQVKQLQRRLEQLERQENPS
jgi:UDP-3-O-[3-hydroxymyristoyl] glucosamine N-acyltransferase